MATDGEKLRRSLRRMTAVVVVPLAALLVQFGIHLREQHGIVSGWESQVIAGSQALGGLLVLGAVGYLVASVLGSVTAPTE